MTTFFDRWGGARTPDADSVVKTRTGAFAVCVTRDHILLSWSRLDPQVAELPGGGIETGEDLGDALRREIFEEAAVEIAPCDPLSVHTQTAHYYSDKNKEFWVYDQTYWLLRGAAVDAVWFEGERSPEDALVARWVSLADLPHTKMHAVHRAALTAWGVLD